MLWRTSFLAIGLLLAGCASTILPPEARGVVLVPVSSAAIELHRPRLLFKRDTLDLEAYVFRQWKAETTADSHVDLVFVDGTGRELAVETTSFSPRSLPNAIRGPKPHAYFKIPIRLPPGTAAIEVRAHDGPHEQKKREA
jgi:hypothetical protein